MLVSSRWERDPPWPRSDRRAGQSRRPAPRRWAGRWRGVGRIRRSLTLAERGWGARQIAPTGPARVGWTRAGDGSNPAIIDAERPHSGQGSLRLEARTLPTPGGGEPFAPPGGNPLNVRVWLRSNPTDLPV